LRAPKSGSVLPASAPERVDMSGTDLLVAFPQPAATTNGVTCNTGNTCDIEAKQ